MKLHVSYCIHVSISIVSYSAVLSYKEDSSSNSLGALWMKTNVSFPLVLVGSGIRPCGKRETPLLGTEHVISAFCVWSALKLVVVLL